MPSVGISVTIWKMRQKTKERPEIDMLVFCRYALSLFEVGLCRTMALL